MNDLDQANCLARRTPPTAPLVLHDRHLQAIENTGQLITAWIAERRPLPQHALMPTGRGGYMIGWRDEPPHDAMTVKRWWNAIQWYCWVCGKSSQQYPGHDEGADAAGLDMLRHALAYPGHGPAMELQCTRNLEKTCPEPEKP